MDNNVLIYPETTTVHDFLAKEKDQWPRYTSHVFLIKEDNTYAGRVCYSRIYDRHAMKPLRQLADHKPVTIYADSVLYDAAQKMNHNQLDSLPVVDKNQKLLGHIIRPWAMGQTPESYKRWDKEELKIAAEAMDMDLEDYMEQYC